jgi:HK97 family phage major capsid protein
MDINYEDLELLLIEANELSNKANFTKQDERRHATLLAQISAVKSGASLRTIMQKRHNEVAVKAGFKPTSFDNLSKEQRAKALFVRKLHQAKDTHELRTALTENEGNLLTAIGTYNSLGQFVPTAFNEKAWHTMAQVDPLFDPNVCTVKMTATASPIEIPLYDDVNNVAVQIGEAADTTGSQVLLGDPTNAVLGAYSYRSPLAQFTNELFDDAAESANIFDTFSEFAGSRCARGIGAKMVLGNGSGTTKGLIQSLVSAGVTGIVAAGSAVNSGGAETGANSIGSSDLARLYFTVNAAYRSSPKCGWMMADSTLLYLSTVVTKMGDPLIRLDGDGPVKLLGKPVFVSPSMPAIGSVSEATTVIFGDLSYWQTRLTGGRIQVFKETYVERGITALGYYMRADGTLAFAGQPANSPINYLIQHS